MSSPESTPQLCFTHAQTIVPIGLLAQNWLSTAYVGPRLDAAESAGGVSDAHGSIVRLTHLPEGTATWATRRRLILRSAD